MFWQPRTVAANPRGIRRGGALALALGLLPGTPLAQEAGDLEQRVEALEQRLDGAEGDQSPWDAFVDEFGGRLEIDETFNLSADRDLERTLGGELEDGAEIRRFRLYVAGAVSPVIAYKVQLDFAGGGTSAKDAYVQLHDLGAWPTITVGHFKEPMGIENLTSDKYLTFMARPMLNDFFTVGRNVGIEASDHFAGKRLNLSLGLFHGDFSGGSMETTNSQSAAGKWNLSGRVTSPVVYAEGGRRLVHLGLSLQHRQSPQDGNTAKQFGFGIEPEVHKTDSFVAGTVPNVDAIRTGIAELAMVIGPFHAQGEYARMTPDTRQGTDPELSAYYVEAGYFLTGEHRRYSKGGGKFARPRPRAPFTGTGGGPGAWQVAARFSHLDLTEADRAAGFSPSLGSATAAEATAEVDVVTAGINWYPTSHAKWMVNYVSADQDALGTADYLLSRFQVDF